MGDTLESVVRLRRRPPGPGVRRCRAPLFGVDLGAHAHTHTFGHVTQTSRSVALLPPCQSLSNRLLQTLDSACTV